MVSSFSLKMGDFDFREMKSLGGGENLIHHTGDKTPRRGDNGNQNGTGGIII